MSHQHHQNTNKSPSPRNTNYIPGPGPTLKTINVNKSPRAVAQQQQQLPDYQYQQRNLKNEKIQNVRNVQNVNSKTNSAATTRNNKQIPSAQHLKQENNIPQQHVTQQNIHLQTVKPNPKVQVAQSNLAGNTCSNSYKNEMEADNRQKQHFHAENQPNSIESPTKTIIPEQKHAKTNKIPPKKIQELKKSASFMSTKSSSSKGSNSHNQVNSKWSKAHNQWFNVMTKYSLEEIKKFIDSKKQENILIDDGVNNFSLLTKLLNSKDSLAGYNILHHAVVRGDRELIEFLLDRGLVDVNSKSDVSENSALHLGGLVGQRNRILEFVFFMKKKFFRPRPYPSKATNST